MGKLKYVGNRVFLSRAGFYWFGILMGCRRVEPTGFYHFKWVLLVFKRVLWVTNELNPWNFTIFIGFYLCFNGFNWVVNE